MASQSTTTAAQGNMEISALTPPPPISVKRKRSLPGHPDPDAEVIALSPRSLMETNRYVCEICGKGFQRDQNLQLHRRGHNLPWRLKQKASHEVRKKVYICPERTCVHHDPARALGDLTGIKKHYSRKHGEKKWKCEKCTKRYAVQSDWKAHQKICGTREYRCDCGTLFSRRDSFITHRAFCDALAEENAKAVDHIQFKDHPLCSTPTGCTGMSTSMEVPSSPLSQLTGDAVTSSEVSNPTIFTSTQSSLSLPESSIASVTSSEAWMKANNRNNNNTHLNGSVPTTKGPGLSLCLGTSTGPGPGPPLSHALIGNPNAASGGADPGPFSYMIQNPSNIMNSIGSDNMHGPTASSSSIGSTSMLENIFPNGYIRHDHSGNNSMASVSSYGKEQIGDHIMQSSSSSSYGMPPSARFNHSPGMAGLMNDFRSANAPPKTSHTSSSAPMSATALLQKAAQMGATISDSSLFHKIGMGEKPPMMMEHRQPSMWASSMSSNMPMGYPKMSHGRDHMMNNTDGTSLIRNHDGMSMSNGRSMEEFMNLMYRDMPEFGKVDIMPSKSGGLSNHGNKFMNNMLEKDHIPNMSSSARKPTDKNSIKHEEEVAMVDFLGVGGSNDLMMQYGGNASVSDILNSHRDLESINQYNSIVNMDRSKLSYHNNR